MSTIWYYIEAQVCDSTLQDGTAAAASVQSFTISAYAIFEANLEGYGDWKAGSAT